MPMRINVYMPLSIFFFLLTPFNAFEMENNIENTRVEAKVYTNQTSIFIVYFIKMPKTLAF